MVLNGGEIVESGPHDELMAATGSYYSLFMTQFNSRAAVSDALVVDFVNT